MIYKDIPIDAPLHRQAEAAANARGESLKDFTERALQLYLDLLDAPPNLADTKTEYHPRRQQNE